MSGLTAFLAVVAAWMLWQSGRSEMYGAAMRMYADRGMSGTQSEQMWFGVRMCWAGMTALLCVISLVTAR